MNMGHQESGEVLMRGRQINTPAPRQQESQQPKQSSSASDGNFTAHNAEFDRRRAELKKLMARDHAAAEAELARLSRRCDILKEFLIETDAAAEELENLSAIINAEKEFAYRLEQLEIRYYRLYGRYSDNVGQPAVKSQENGENLTMVQRPSSFKNALPLAAAVLLAALIIAAAMAMIFL